MERNGNKENNKYNIDFIVKYKTIEEELLGKIQDVKNIQSHKTVAEQLGYDDDDVLQICHDLYQHELLSVFNLTEFDDIKMNVVLDDLFKKLEKSHLFMDIFNNYKDNFYLNNISQNAIFASMFNYNHFKYIHECIVRILKKEEITHHFISKIKNKLTIN